MDSAGCFLHLYCNNDCQQSNCSLFNQSALGYTLRFHKRSVLNRTSLPGAHVAGGSFLLADRSFPELPYIQIPFSEQEIEASAYPDLLSSYNYWHHRSRFVAQQSIQRWLFRCPRCRRGLSFSSERNFSYAVASLVLCQLCQRAQDLWTDDDAQIRPLVLAGKDAAREESADAECYALYDALSSEPTYETRYYNLENTVVPRPGARDGEEADEPLRSSIYEKLRVVARRRRELLLNLIQSYPLRSAIESCPV